MKMKKWRLLCAGLAAAGVFVVGMPGEQVPVAEAMYSSVDASHHWYKAPNQQQKLMILAAKEGDYDTVKSMIDSGVDVNGVYPEGSYNPRGTTALEIAMRSRHRDIMQLLLESGANPTGFYYFDGTLALYISEAVQMRLGVEPLQYLHNWGADINAVSSSGWMKGNALSCLMFMAKRDAFIYISGEQERLEMAKYLLEQGINPEVKNANDVTPFIEAASMGWINMIDVLADGGANVYAKDGNGRDAMQIALDKGWLEVYKHVKAIMERGNQPSNYTPPAGASISGSAAQAKVDRGTSLGKYAELYKKYSDASNQIYNELEAALADTSSGVTKEKLSKEKDAIKQLKKLNEKMAKEDPLKGFKGYSVGEREKFTDLFDGLTEYNDAMIALLEYVVAHPTDGDHDQLVNLTAQVIKVQGDQKDRAAAVQEILQKK